MLEGLKEILIALQGVPDMALWILGGYLFYKLFIIGSVYGVIRFGIEKMYHAYIKSKEPKPPEVKTVEFDFGSMFFIRNEGNLQRFLKLIDLIRVYRYDMDQSEFKENHKRDTPLGNGKAYLHKEDIDWFENAVRTQAAKDFASLEVPKL